MIHYLFLFCSLSTRHPNAKRRPLKCRYADRFKLFRFLFALRLWSFWSVRTSKWSFLFELLVWASRWSFLFRFLDRVFVRGCSILYARVCVETTSVGSSWKALVPSLECLMVFMEETLGRILLDGFLLKSLPMLLSAPTESCSLELLIRAAHRNLIYDCICIRALRLPEFRATLPGHQK